MPSKQKFKAKPVFYDLYSRTVKKAVDIERYRLESRLTLPSWIVRFDSQHEFKVYLELVRIYGVDRILRQHSLEILPKSRCYPNGRKWRADFAVLEKADGDDILYIVEAKGYFTPEFGFVLTMLEQFNSETFEKLRIVFSISVPSKKLIVKALLKTEYQKNLITYQQIQKINHLP